ncbi:MAG: cohesin domain-containing protein [Eubacteriales bacterium]
MKRNFTRLFAGIVIICMLVTATLTFEVGAATNSAISASTGTAECSSSVNVVISLDNNPGIWSMGFNVGYDHAALTLTGVTVGDIFTSEEVTPPPSLDKETYLFLASRSSLTDTTANGTLVTLTFSVAANAAFQDYPIVLDLSSKNTINKNQ